jgi:trigger factor
MQVTQISGDGLSRIYGVIIPATELGAKLEEKIAEIAPKLRLKGFRPGKVPPAHVRRIYGKALMGELVQETLSESTQKVVEDAGLRIAAQPSLNPQSDLEEVIAGRQDLSFQLDVEVMPDFDPADVASLELVRLVHEPTDEEVDEALADLAGQSRTYEPREGENAKAADGDRLTIDFTGRIDGKEFEGGKGEDAQLVLGSGSFIPGFEEQLIGASAGDERTVQVRFPDAYAVERLRGKDAEFEVEVKEVAAPQETVLDDALAERFGLTDLEALKAALTANLAGQFAGATRMKVKRALLDKLDAAHDFPLPPKMVEAEFATIWREVEAERARGELDPDDAAKSEDDLKADYRKIAERRVRLGLVLAEIGRRNGVAVSDDEVLQAMRQEAVRYGNEAQRVFDLMRQNPQMQAQVRAPIFEDKVVDLILATAKVDDRNVSKAELLAEDELPEGYGSAKSEEGDAEAKPGRAKKAAPKAKSSATAPSAAKTAEAGEAPPKKRASKAKAAEPAEEAAAAPAKPKRASKAKPAE